MASVQQLEVSWLVVCAACCHMALVFAVMHLNNFFFIASFHSCFVVVYFFRTPKGGREYLMSPPCLESQGCHLIPLCYLLSCSSPQSCYPFCLIVFCLLALSCKLFPENSSIFSLRDRLFCMAPVQRLGEDSWSVVCAACCHMTLVYAVKHLYNIFEFFIASVHSFFFFILF